MVTRGRTKAKNKKREGTKNMLVPFSFPPNSPTISSRFKTEQTRLHSFHDMERNSKDEATPVKELQSSHLIHPRMTTA